MPKADLQQWLISKAGFQKNFTRLLIDSVASQFSTLNRSASLPENVDWSYMLFCASILADSPRSDCQDAALRIAQTCISTSTATAQEKDAAAIVLDDLANRLAIDLSIRRELVRPNLPSRLGAVSRIEWTRRSLENSITLADYSSIFTNRFQKRFWEAVQSNVWTSTSAPTSAGKSFIVLEAVSDFFLTRPEGLVIYIVPTRALIHQVETDFRALKQKRSLESVTVSSIPLKGLLRDESGNFFVFTQERLHLFLSAFETPPHIDMIIVDEAHKLGDGARGVLLQDVIERVTLNNSSLKVIFASPQTENPEILLSEAPPTLPTKAVHSVDITVNQNLIWATQVPHKPKRWELSVCLAEQISSLGFIGLAYTPKEACPL